MKGDNEIVFDKDKRRISISKSLILTDEIVYRDLSGKKAGTNKHDFLMKLKG